MGKRQTKVLTDRQIRSWIAAGKPIAKSDGDGLTFTLSEAGMPVFILRYRVHGRRREKTIGRYPDMSLKAAREEASADRLAVAKGVDVAAEKRRRNHASVAAWTVRQVVAHFEKESLTTRADSTRKLYGLLIKNWLLPRMGAMLARDVQRADIVAMLRAAAPNGSGGMRSLYQVTRLVFGHAVGQAIRDTNPASDIQLGTIKAPTERRVGVALTRNELQAFMRALPDNVEGWALHLHLITGARPSELIEAEWAEFSDDYSIWSLPAARTKTNQAIAIQLPSQARQLVEKISQHAHGTKYLFPARYGSTDRAVPYQTYRAWLWRNLDRAGSDCPRIKPHDIRRTMRSGLTTLGIRYEVAERAINHKLPQMAEIYDRNDYAEERAEALITWASHLDGLSGR